MDLLEKIISLSKRKGFVFQSSEIYGGLNGCWDFGPLGVELLKNIKDELKKRGCEVPLIADIHFTPNAAEEAARIIEKVRVNPGNYIDKKKFQQIEYTDIEYEAEIERIRKRFSPDQIIFLNKIKWWDKDFEWLEQNAELLLDIEIFMNSYNEK